MRDIIAWKKELSKVLNKYTDGDESLNINKLCDIELGLTLWYSLFKEESCLDLWAFLTGYSFNDPIFNNLNDIDKSRIGALRQYLSFYKSKQLWKDYIEKYMKLNAKLRLFDIDNAKFTVTLRDTANYSKRYEVYNNTLNAYPDFKKTQIKFSKSGEMYFIYNKVKEKIYIPDSWCSKKEIINNNDIFQNSGKVKPINIRISELLETARMMDEKLGGDNWSNRMDRIRILACSENVLSESDRISLNGLYNMVGMVSSGKSTLMQVIAIWAAKRGIHTTLVVDSTNAVMNIVELMEKINIPVVPILGSDRDEHLKKYHLVREVSNFDDMIEFSGLKWLSTVCPLDGLRNNRFEDKSFIPGNEPCMRLCKEDEKAYYICPLYYNCQKHIADNNMENALVFVATPASLIYTWAPEIIYGVKIRMFELIYRKSDIVIFDEADKVQVQFDEYFSPTQVLTDGKGSSWLNKLGSSVERSFYESGRSQLRSINAVNWKEAYKGVQSSVDKLYRILLNKKEIRQWAAKEHFSAQYLVYKLVENMDDKNEEEKDRIIRNLLDFKEDPMAEKNEHILCEAYANINSNANSYVGYKKIEKWCDDNQVKDENIVDKLEFIIFLSTLEKNLKRLIDEWDDAEDSFNLDAEGLSFFKNYLYDFIPIMPESATGNLFGFEFQEGKDSSPGKLLVFRFMGIGRWILLNFSSIFSNEGIVGPHTILLSGTSWAPGSSSYHIQIPVSAVLKAPDTELKAIEKSEFFFKPAYFNNEPIRISGLEGQDRINALKKTLDYILEEGTDIRLGNMSLLEHELDLLGKDNKRLLMVTGNYDEAKIATDYINEKMMRNSKWKDKFAFSLFRDSDDIGDDFVGIRRSNVDKFLYENAKVLVAPLLAIERGHNILNEDSKALLGSVFFLIRPMPIPNDMNNNTLYMNHFAIKEMADNEWIRKIKEEKAIGSIGSEFRRIANAEWNMRIKKDLSRRGGIKYKKYEEIEDLYWTRLVLVWQVIGRLIRGGQDARVFFIDAAFAEKSASGLGKDDFNSSMLKGFSEVLGKYFCKNYENNFEKQVAVSLYGPFYKVLSNIKGVE